MYTEVHISGRWLACVPPGPIWTFYNLPSKTAQDLSYDAAFLLIVFLLVLIIVGRLITWFARQNSEYL